MTRAIRYTSDATELGYLRLALYDQVAQRCWVDGQQHEWGALDIDHVIPVSRFDEIVQEFRERGRSVDFDVDDVENLAAICRRHNIAKSNRALAAMEIELELAKGRAERIRRAVQGHRQRPIDSKVVIDFLSLDPRNDALVENGHALAQHLADASVDIAESWIRIEHLAFVFGASEELHGVVSSGGDGRRARRDVDVGVTQPLELTRELRVDDSLLRRSGLTLRECVETGLEHLRKAIEHEATREASHRFPDADLAGSWEFGFANLELTHTGLDPADVESLVLAGRLDVDARTVLRRTELYFADADGNDGSIHVEARINGLFRLVAGDWRNGSVDWDADQLPNVDIWRS